MASKIIVVGDVNGQLSDVFGKLAKLHAKNTFVFAIIAGNLFADPSSASEDQHQEVIKLLQGQIEVALPTYFALDNRALPAVVSEKLTKDQGELCPNLFILGRKVSVKTSEGIKLVAIGGAHVETSDESMDEYAAIYTDKDVESAKDFRDADILITSDWPAGVRDGSKISFPGEAPTGVKTIGELCTALKPRYHFSTSEAFFQREPYFHQGPPPRSVSRFLSLAPHNNSDKQKAMYAFSLEPSAPPPEHLPSDVTASPFALMQKRKRDTDDTSNGFRYSNGNGRSYRDEDREHQPKRRQQRGPRPPPRQEECFLCLSNRDVEAHMITSIGDEVYVTVSKGPLTTRKTFTVIGLPCHMMIIPLSHAPTIAAIEDAESRKSTVAEMKRFREALHSMVASKSTNGADGKARLGAVTWEISKGSGVHVHWQFLPVPVDLVDRNLVEAAFDVEAENNSYAKFAKSEAEMAEAEEGDYFKAMIWSESKQKEMVLPLEKGTYFDMQFGRRVLGKLLGLDSRAHWKDCAQTQEEEADDAEKFKAAFKGYDFSRPKEEQEEQTDPAEPDKQDEPMEKDQEAD